MTKEQNAFIIYIMKKRQQIKAISLLIFFSILFSACKHDDTVNFEIGEITVINSNSISALKGYYPDGKLCTIQLSEDEWQMFWAEKNDYLTVSSSPWPEDHCSQVKNSNMVFGKDKLQQNPEHKITNFNENGSWFIGVFPLNQENDGQYAGFFHAESHYDNNGTAHKSIGVAYSDDYGRNWNNVQPVILSEQAKGQTPAWTGIGDGCVIRDRTNSHWICYYQGKTNVNGSINNRLCMASSSDPEGKSGTWKKWDGTNFSISACNTETMTGGTECAIKNLSKVPGANPSVSWNEYLQSYVMVYASWSHEVYISFSNDAINWTNPVYVIGSSANPLWYPNLISEKGDTVSLKCNRIYFSYQQDENGIRKIAYVPIEFF